MKINENQVLLLTQVEHKKVSDYLLNNNKEKVLYAYTYLGELYQIKNVDDFTLGLSLNSNLYNLSVSDEYLTKESEESTSEEFDFIYIELDEAAEKINKNSIVIAVQNEDPSILQVIPNKIELLVAVSQNSTFKKFIFIKMGAKCTFFLLTFSFFLCYNEYNK